MADPQDVVDVPSLTSHQAGMDDYGSSSWSGNGSAFPFLPTVNGIIIGKVITLCVMIIVSTVGNVATVIITSRLRRRRKSTVTLLVLHLAIADLGRHDVVLVLVDVRDRVRDGECDG